MCECVVVVGGVCVSVLLVVCVFVMDHHDVESALKQVASEGFL